VGVAHDYIPDRASVAGGDYFVEGDVKSRFAFRVPGFAFGAQSRRSPGARRISKLERKTRNAERETFSCFATLLRQ
jgi:hypothetical protein